MQAHSRKELDLRVWLETKDDTSRTPGPSVQHDDELVDEDGAETAPAPGPGALLVAVEDRPRKGILV